MLKSQKTKIDWKDPDQVRRYHREYRRANKDRLNAKARERYLNDPEYRQQLADSSRRYLTTPKGQTTRRASKVAFAERNPDYAYRYAKEHTAEAVVRANRWRDTNLDQYRANMRRHAEKRRAQKRNAFVEDIERLVVLELDDGVCGICEEDVDPFCFHIDHIIPLAKGGEHSYANVQVTHPSCNERKNATIC